MTHDEELEVRRQFLEEAQEYIDAIADGLINLDRDRDDFRAQIDGVLRASHSLKGASAMMQYEILSHSAHQLEDAFKLLKSHSPVIDENIERLLLISVDYLSEIVVLHRQGQDCDRQWFEINAAPTLQELNEYISAITDDIEGDTNTEDDEANVVALMFESEVEEYLGNLEQLLEQHQPDSELAENLKITAEDLAAMAEILELPQFQQLCQQVADLVKTIPVDRIKQLTSTTLSAWRRSQALVLTGNINTMPSQLELPDDLLNTDTETISSAAPDDITSDITNNENINENINNIDELAELEQLVGSSAQNLTDSAFSNYLGNDHSADLSDKPDALISQTAQAAEQIQDEKDSDRLTSNELETLVNIAEIEEFAGIEDIEEIAIVSGDISDRDADNINDINDSEDFSDLNAPEPALDPVAANMATEANITDNSAPDPELTTASELLELDSQLDQQAEISQNQSDRDLFAAIAAPEGFDLEDTENVEDFDSLPDFGAIDSATSTSSDSNDDQSQPARPSQTPDNDLFAAIDAPSPEEQDLQAIDATEISSSKNPKKNSEIPDHTGIPDTLGDLQAEIEIKNPESIATESQAKPNLEPKDLSTPSSNQRTTQT
jgi:chemotaxis protein histidine kinase CheA